MLFYARLRQAKLRDAPRHPPCPPFLRGGRAAFEHRESVGSSSTLPASVWMLAASATNSQTSTFSKLHDLRGGRDASLERLEFSGELFVIRHVAPAGAVFDANHDRGIQGEGMQGAACKGDRSICPRPVLFARS